MRSDIETVVVGELPRGSREKTEKKQSPAASLPSAKKKAKYKVRKRGKNGKPE